MDRTPRKPFLVSWAVAAACLLLPALAAQASDFRGFSWGASKAEVRRGEDLPLHHDLPDEVAYWNFELVGVPAGLVYTFEDGKLVRAHYLSRNRTPVAEEDYRDYLTFRKHFDAELGSTGEEEWVWTDGVPRPDEESVDAIVAGRARLVTRWKGGAAKVEMVLVGQDGQMESLRVYFEPRR